MKHHDFIPTIKEIWDASCHAETTFDRIQMKLKNLSNTSKGGDLTCKVFIRKPEPT
jgi:hypothetical protein